MNTSLDKHHHFLYQRANLRQYDEVCKEVSKKTSHLLFRVNLSICRVIFLMLQTYLDAI